MAQVNETPREGHSLQWYLDNPAPLRPAPPLKRGKSGVYTGPSKRTRAKRASRKGRKR